MIFDNIRKIIENREIKQAEAFSKLVKLECKVLNKEDYMTPTCDICGISRRIQLKDAPNSGFNTLNVMSLNERTVEFFMILCNGCINRQSEICEKVKELRQTNERKIKYEM